MNWFNGLEPQEQQNFVRTMIGQKFMRYTEKREDSNGVGLITFKQGHKSYFVSGVPPNTMTDLRQLCKKIHVNYISNQEGDFMVDLGSMTEEAEPQLRDMLLSGNCAELTQVDYVPDSLKADYYYTL